MSSLQADVEYTVDMLVEQVARWPSGQRQDEYKVNRLPIHLLLPALARRIGGEYVVVGTETGVVVRRRATDVKYADAR